MIVVRVLVTGAAGFVGSNLTWALRNIAEGRDRRDWVAPLRDVEVLELDRDNAAELPKLAAQADFVIHLAGVNRADDPQVLLEGNRALAEDLVRALEDAGNSCPVLLASSVQATLEGRFANSAYGRGKLAAEEAIIAYGARTGARTCIYRLVNVYGKWCRPNYNSAVATFCHNVARDLPITVNDPAVALDLIYVDDLVEEFLRALLGQETRGMDGLCHARPVDHATVGELAETIRSFHAARTGVEAPDCTPGSLRKKLLSTYRSYLPPDRLAYDLDAHVDERGFFAEFLRTPSSGQVSVNLCHPGQVKGNHWHNTKWEKFLVVSGEALVRLRQVPHGGEASSGDIIEFRVCGSEPRVVEMPPGYAHSIANTSPDQDLVLIIWSNEAFDPDRPDTYYLEV